MSHGEVVPLFPKAEAEIYNHPSNARLIGLVVRYSLPRPAAKRGV